MIQHLPALMALLTGLSLFVLVLSLAAVAHTSPRRRWRDVARTLMSLACVALAWQGNALADDPGVRRLETELRTSIRWALAFEGATVDANQTFLTVVDPTADRTIKLPDASGTIAVSGQDITFDTGLSGGADISVAQAAAATAASTLDITGQQGGTAATGGVGKNGGATTITGGAGTAKNGAGATDGDGGDVVLTGGARGGFTATTEVQGIVRVGNPTVGSPKTVDLLAVAGGLEVDGAAKLDGDIKLGTKCTGTVSTNAVTCSGNAGVITDDSTDINLDATRTAITWTNTAISATSVIVATSCSTNDANAAIHVTVVPGSGTATLSLRNVGTGNQTTNGSVKVCFAVLN